MRKAGPGDFGQLVSLSAIEDWNYQVEDFIKLEETGCARTLVAEDEGELRGMITVFDYGDVGWISNVLVDSRFRGEGIGRRLLEEGLQNLKGKSTITLFTYNKAKDFYLRQGFKFEADYHFAKFLSHSSSSAKVRNMGARPVDEVASMDYRAFGYKRPGLLRMLMGIGEVLEPIGGGGFALCRPDPLEPAVGPVVAEDRESGLELLYAALTRVGPGCSAVLPSMVGSMEELETISRLYLGEKPFLDRSRVFALTGLEYG